MRFPFFQTALSKLIILFFVLSFSSCSSQNYTQDADTTEDYSAVKIHEEEAQNPQKRNKNKLEGLLIKKADSFYFASNFKQAQTLYDMALNNVTYAETKKYLIEKIADTKGKIEENTAKISVEKKDKN